MRVFLLLTLISFCTAVTAQTNVRVRGTITAFDDNLLSVKSREGKDLQIRLTPDAAVATAKAISLVDLKPGTYVGSTTRKQGGRLVALTVHTLSPQVPAGYTPWDLEPDTSMTNATLTAVAQVSGGNEITLEYPGGAQKILVPPGTPVVTTVPGSRADLKPGEYIFTGARQEADGKLVAQRIQVSKDGVRPPQ